MYCFAIYAMANAYGTDTSTIILLLPFCFILLGIYLIVAGSKDKEESNELKRLRQLEQQQREQLYPNRNYKAKNSAFYLMTPKQKLEYAYDRLPEKEQEKVQRYAETLLREIENQKYNQK